MFEIIKNMIGFTYDAAASNLDEVHLIYVISGVCIVVFSVTLIDLLYRTFRHFWR